MLTSIIDANGKRLAATVELDDGSIILHSRGGAFGKPNLRNPEYRAALRLIIERVQDSDLATSGVWLDSRVAQNWPEPQRQLLQADELKLPVKEILTLIGQRGASRGRPDGATGHGNSTKRIKIGVPGVTAIQLQKLLVAVANDDGDLTSGLGRSGTTSHGSGLPDHGAEVSPSELRGADGERNWAEGSPKRVQHLLRERAPGLAQAKKRNFIKVHGRLFCERCGLIPTQSLGPFGDACIEVHHQKLAIAAMKGRTQTRLDHLQCLCANCHRIVHREQL